MLTWILMEKKFLVISVGHPIAFCRCTQLIVYAACILLQNNPHSGSNLRVAPNALVDDGLLGMTDDRLSFTIVSSWFFRHSSSAQQRTKGNSQYVLRSKESRFACIR